MGMLDRYRKKGGFEQLLTLLETSSHKKREQLLGLIEKEDKSWAKLLKAKVLTFEHMMKWDMLMLAEITHHIPPKVLAVAIKSYGEEGFKKATATIPHMKVLEIKAHFDAPHGASEIESAQHRIVQTARELVRDGKISIKDPCFDIDVTSKVA